MGSKSINRFLWLILFLSSLFFVSSNTIAAALVAFTSEKEAQIHCPHDEVVWLNFPTKIWHAKWQRWYGRTKSGAYVCKQEAIATGNRASLRG